MQSTSSTTNLRIQSEVRSVMTTQLITVKPQDPVLEVNRMFDLFSFHHIPVIKGGKLVGILSDRDIVDCLCKQQQTENVVENIMTPEPITIDSSTTIECASILLLENQISCLPIVDTKETLIGILTWKDLLRFYVYHQ